MEKPPTDRRLSPLYGLVLNGGKSRRMKQCKATLCYHGKPQLAHTFELLLPYCEQVFISHRKDQADFHGEFPQIHDMYQNVGPVGGILSAMATFPDVAWCVLANDLPYVDAETIRTLIQHRNPLKVAVAYHNPQGSFPEPLCTIYEPAMKARLLEFLDSERRVFRKVLESDDIQLLKPQNEFTLINVNYPEEYDQALEYLSKSTRGSQYGEFNKKSFQTLLSAWTE